MANKELSDKQNAAGFAGRAAREEKYGKETSYKILEQRLKDANKEYTVRKKYIEDLAKYKTGLDTKTASLAHALTASAREYQLKGYDEKENAAKGLADLAKTQLKNEKYIGTEYFEQIDYSKQILDAKISGNKTEEETLKSLQSQQQAASLYNKHLNKALDPIKKMKAKFKEIGQVVKMFVTNPLVLGFAAAALAAGLLVKLFKSAWKMFSEIQAAGESFRRETGIMSTELEAAAMSANLIPGSYKEGFNAVKALHKAWGNVNQITKNQVIQVAKLTEEYGVSNEAAAGSLKVFQELGNLTAKQAIEIQNITLEEANKSGVVFADVLDEISSSSSAAYNYFAGSPKALAKAAIEAKRMGLSLDKMVSMSDSLLDIESSIEAQMKANLLTGKNMNFQKARELAMAGDAEGAAKAALKQVGSYSDFLDMNVYQRKSIAAAAGLEVGELTSILKKQSDLAKYGTKRLTSNKKMASTLTQLKRIWTAIKLTLVKHLVPVFEKITKYLLKQSNTVKGTLGPVMESIGKTLRKWLEKIISFFTELGKGKDGVFSISNVFSKIKETFISIIGKAKKWIKILKIVLMIWGSIWVLAKLMKGVKLVGGLFGKGIGAATKAGGGIGKVIKNIGKAMKHIDPVKMLAAAASMAIIAAAVWIMAKAMQQFSTGVSWKGVAMGLVSMIALAGVAVGLSFVAGNMIVGAIAIGILAIGLWILAKALQEFSGNIDWKQVGIAVLALVVLAGIAAGLGFIAPFIIAGAIAIAVLGIGLWCFAKGVSAMEGVNTEKLGKQFEDLGNALKNLNLKTILKLAAAAIPLAAFGVALLAFSIGVSAMEKTNTNELSTQFKSLGISLKSLNLKTMLKLAAVAIPLAAFGLSLIPLSKGLKKLKDVKANNLGSILESIGTGLKSFNRKATKTLTKIAKPLAYFGRGLIGVAKAAKTLIKTDLTKINKKFVDLFTAIVNALNTFDKDSTNILQKVGRPLAGFGAGLKNIVDATKEMSKEGSFSKKMVILAKGIREIGSVETVAAMDRLGNMRAELRAFSLGFAIFLELIPQIPSLNEIPIKSFNALSQVIQIIGSAETVAAMDRLGDMRAELRAFSLGLVWFLELIPQIPTKIPVKSFEGLALGIREIGSAETVDSMNRLGKMKAELRAFSLGFTIFLEMVPKIPTKIPKNSFENLAQGIRALGTKNTINAMKELGKGNPGKKLKNFANNFIVFLNTIRRMPTKISKNSFENLVRGIRALGAENTINAMKKLGDIKSELTSFSIGFTNFLNAITKIPIDNPFAIFITTIANALLRLKLVGLANIAKDLNNIAKASVNATVSSTKENIIKAGGGLISATLNRVTSSVKKKEPSEENSNLYSLIAAIERGHNITIQIDGKKVGEALISYSPDGVA